MKAEPESTHQCDYGRRMALGRSRRPPRAPVGKEPDVRFTYANERTFLAWNRTSLALIATGLAVVALLPKLNVPGGRRLIGVPLIGLGAVLALLSYRQWAANERAMRLGQPLPPSNLSRVLAIGVAAAATVAAVVAAFGAK
jgi:putative membrane protein